MRGWGGWEFMMTLIGNETLHWLSHIGWGTKCHTENALLLFQLMGCNWKDCKTTVSQIKGAEVKGDHSLFLILASVYNNLRIGYNFVQMEQNLTSLIRVDTLTKVEKYGIISTTNLFLLNVMFSAVPSLDCWSFLWGEKAKMLLFSAIFIP